MEEDDELADHDEHDALADISNLHDSEDYSHNATEAQRANASILDYTADSMNLEQLNDLDCDEAQWAPQQTLLLERLAARAHGTDTSSLDDAWDATMTTSTAPPHHHNPQGGGAWFPTSRYHTFPPRGGQATCHHI